MSFAKISSIAILGLLVGHFATYCCAEVTFDIITLSPLLWNETVQDVGNEIVDVVVLDRPLKHFNEKLARHFYAMVSAACILTVLNMAVPIVWMFRQYRRKTPPYQPIQFTKLENRNDTGIYAPIPPNPWRLGHYKYMQGAFAYTFFYTIFVITGFLFIYSCKQFVRTLQRWIPSISEESIFYSHWE
ncbi:expressed unknown protein [Seminavis robusta]|uniref:CSC1/OSCA1-like N-terminal transmembrane domain-containing protein n=1 Tax=Seminavis robusta TaxID=568900 RepID=A0A9N8EWR2_9STRA|nr:expressed unknown protein [Seminavis robusta]|eukprot:Sro2551_g330970.1 n/a (187) ;mRNA; r:1150-1710